MSRFLPWLQSRTPQRIAAVVFASMLLWHFLLFRRGYFSKAQEHLVTAPQVVLDQAILDIQSPCDSLSGLQDVFLAVRTGANEAHERLPVHFNTTLRCLPSGSFGIWSDLEEDIGAHHLQNALDEINPEIMATHPDFEYYKRLQEHGRAAFTTEELTEWGAAPNSAGGRDTPGWKLDKWKFLPIADKAHQQKPDAKWFIFMEGDTYINWRNLLEWLSHIDATKPYYLGNEMQIGDVIFAYGGSGFVISNPAMKSLVEQHANNPGVYEDITADHWAGDCVLGKALFDAGVKLSWQKPNHFGGMPFDMAYGETFGSPLRSLWCYYVTTYHHMTSPDIKEVSAFEQRWAQGVSPDYFCEGPER